MIPSQQQVRVAPNPIRCPSCNKLLCEHMEAGLFQAMCPRCHQRVVVDRRRKVE